MMSIFKLSLPTPLKYGLREGDATDANFFRFILSPMTLRSSFSGADAGKEGKLTSYVNLLNSTRG
jgi:hypothetical protein